MNTSKTLWSLLLGGALLTAACGDAKSAMNPVAPTAVVAGATLHDESGGAVSSGMGKPANPGNGNGNSNNGNNGNGNGNGNNGGGNGNGKGNQPTVPVAPTLPTNTTPPAPTNTTPTTTRKVEIEGMISAKGTAQITVNGQAIDVPATATIRHGNTPFTFADLHVGDRVHVKGDRTTTGTGATATTTIEATEVKLQNPGDDEDENEEGEDGGTPSSTGSAIRPRG